MLKRRISSTLAAIVAVILGVVVMPAVPTAGAAGEIPGNGDIEVGIYQVDENYSRIQDSSFPTKYLVSEGAITPDSFKPMAALQQDQRQYCLLEVGNGDRVGCLYRRVYLKGGEGNWTIPIQRLTKRGDKILVTPLPNENFPHQDQVDLIVPASRSAEYIFAEFMATEKFVAVNYTFEGVGTSDDGSSSLKEFKGTGFESDGRQILSRGNGDEVAAQLSVKFDRAFDIKFEKGARSTADQATYSISSPDPNKDYSTVSTTIQTREIKISNLNRSVPDVYVNVQTPRKTGNAQIKISSRMPAGAVRGSCKSSGVYNSGSVNDFCGGHPGYRNYGLFTKDATRSQGAETQELPIRTSNGQATWYYDFTGGWDGGQPKGDGSGNVFLGQINLNGQIMAIPFPKLQLRSRQGDNFLTWYVGKRQKVLSGRNDTLFEQEIQSGVNAGVKISVYLDNARSSLETRGLDDYSTNTTFRVCNGEGAYAKPVCDSDWSHDTFQKYIWSTRYKVVVSNLQKAQNTLDLSWTSTVNTWIYNGGSYGVVASGNDDKTVGFQLYGKSADGDSTKEFHAVCYGGDSKVGENGCEELSWKRSWVAFTYDGTDLATIRFRYANGFGPDETEPITSYHNDEPIYGSPWGPYWYTGDTKHGQVAENDSRPAGQQAWYNWDLSPISDQGSLQVDWGAGIRKLGYSYNQPVVIKAKPFDFTVTQKTSSSARAPELQGTSSATYNVRDNFVFSLDRGIPELEAGESFIGYNLYACDANERCVPMLKNDQIGLGDRASVNEPSKITSACMASDMNTQYQAWGNKPLPRLYPGSTVDLNDWNICWSQINGKQKFTEIRAVPANDSGAGVTSLPIMYRADFVKHINGVDDTRQGDFVFQGVPGIGATYTASWLAANSTRTWRGDTQTWYLSTSAPSVLTVDALDDPGTANSANALLAYYTNTQSNYKVWTQWQLNGQDFEVDPPSGVTSSVFIDGEEVDQDADLSGTLGNHTLSAAVQWQSKPAGCSVDQLKYGRLSEANPSDLPTDGAKIQIQDGDTWVVYANLVCDQTLTLTLQKPAKALNEPDFTQWGFTATGTMPQQTIDLGHIAGGNTYGDKSVQIDPPSNNRAENPYTTSLTMNNADGTTDQLKYRNVFARGDWSCGDTADYQKNQGSESIRMRLGINATCTAQLSVAEVTLLERFVVPTTDSDSLAFSSQPSGSDGGIRMAASIGTSLGNLVAVPGDTLTLPEAVVPAGAETIPAATRFVAAGKSYTFELRDAAGFYKVRALKYNGTVANFADTDISDTSKWKEITEPYIPTEDNRDIILLEVAQVRGPVVLPLTGGKAQDLFIFAGLAATALATALGALQWHRRRRVPITL